MSRPLVARQRAATVSGLVLALLAGMAGPVPSPVSPTPAHAGPPAPQATPARAPSPRAVAVSAGPGHTGVVGNVPATNTPNIMDGSVSQIHEAGGKVVVAGTFTAVQSPGSATTLPRAGILAFDKATGVVDTAFAPQVNGSVRAVIAGPVPGTVTIAGSFTAIGSVVRRKVAVLNLADGSVLTSFAGPVINAAVNDIVRAGSRLILAGSFSLVGGQARRGLAAIDATTGAFDPAYLTADLTEHHNYDEAEGGARAPVGSNTLAMSPDGTQLVAIGNFKRVNGQLSDQIVKLDLGAGVATVANWNTTRYTPSCAWWAFDTYMRDVAWSPDGRYFTVVTTGAPFSGTLCDTVARWEAAATGTDLEPTWISWSGGDTFLSTAITETAVYVGGHMRWMNNPYGADSAAAGAVARPSLAALDPVSGVPLKWNPGRNPRGYGVSELYATPTGLWIGHDTKWMGNNQYRRERIAFLPLASGYTPHATTTAALPGKVYEVAPGVGNPPPSGVAVRTYDGGTAVGPLGPVAAPGDTAWSTVGGAFWVGGTLFYGIGNSLYRRTFNGSAFGAPATVDPYHDPYWDNVLTRSDPPGQTYAGVTPTFYGELPTVGGIFYSQGRLYYSLVGQGGLFWRWFSPDSGIVSGERYEVPGAGGFADAGGLFVSGGRLYVADRHTGTLSTLDWTGTGPSGTPVPVSGPLIDGHDWRARALFVAP